MEIKNASLNEIDEKTIIRGNCTLGKNCRIINSVLENANIGDNVYIINSTIINSTVKNNVTIGPYAHLRKNTYIDDDVRIGNFVEIKSSIIQKRTKIAHLAYIGDAKVGEDVNVGCGVIFVNYNGKNKNKIEVGDRVFIGSNSNLVAPLFIENDVFIAAGTTVTTDLNCGDFCIGRVKNEIKKVEENLYSQKFIKKNKYFGTDGIRGVFNKDLTPLLAKKVGYSLTQLTKNARVIIGYDTRQSSKELLQNLYDGIIFGGGTAVCIGVVPTPCVCYLTKLFNFSYGVMITASHNPSEYNGIKIFNQKGYKLCINDENRIENIIDDKQEIITKKNKIEKAENIAYIEFIKSLVKDYTNLKIFLDLSNGALQDIAFKVFLESGAKLIVINRYGEINKNASVLNKDIFKTEFNKSNADIGFCFDGDGDRVMCITKNGLLDGDKILYLLSLYYKAKYVVGTVMTNGAFDDYYKEIGTKLIRVDVGDRNIAKLIKSKKYSLGGEESGHIIISDYLTTGDGLLTAVILLNIYQENKELFLKTLNLKTYDSYSENIITNNKDIIKNDEFLDYKVYKEKLLKKGRIIVRPSGTEPKIRITVEGEDKKIIKKTLQDIKNYINKMLEKNIEI